MTEGEQKFKETGEKLKKEAADKKVEQEKAMVEAKTNLEKLKANPDLMKMYQENADVGSENLAGQMPYLKVHAAGRSSTNLLGDGKEPNDGWFFYKPTQEQFETVECHVLTISSGYRAEPLEKRDDNKKQFNQILAGVIIQEGKFLPFLMIFSGLKLSYLWEFGKEASQYTKARPVGIPLFALKVKLTTEKIKNKFNKSWIVHFEIMKNEDGSPLIVTDPRLFQSLRGGVEKAQDRMSALISSKSVADPEENTERL